MSSAFRLFICTQVLSVPCDVLLLLQLPSAQARSWGAAEEWLGWEDFRQQLHSQPYAPMLHCDSWKAISHLVFPSLRHNNRAVQAVEVVANRGSDAAASKPATSYSASLRSHAFTFCLEKIQAGPYEGCWLTVGVRVGNYAL
eukprot:jgi/Chrzof1/10571/Cz05g03260.t1